MKGATTFVSKIKLNNNSHQAEKINERNEDRIAPVFKPGMSVTQIKIC